LHAPDDARGLMQRLGLEWRHEADATAA
jgi:hypothetical protein